MSQSTLSSQVSGPRPGENTWIWLIKIITGPLLVIVVLLHLIVNHYLGSMSSGLMTYADIVKYCHNPSSQLLRFSFWRLSSHIA